MVACRMSEAFHQHIPVLLNEAVAHLITSSDGIYIDATFGRGNHSQAILAHLSSKGRLVAFDRDPDAIQYAREHFSTDSRFQLIHSCFSQMAIYLSELKLFGQVQGILFDLGVSSPQFDNSERGFSFSKDGPLDMRMDTSQGINAAELLATIDETELADMLWQYGEERHSRRIARAIVQARAQAPITTTAQLAKIIESVMPYQKEKHPATRSFQAIRIAINQELTELQAGLDQALEALSIGGRLCVISFHSLEDRIAKQFINQHEKGLALPRGLPIKHQPFQGRMKSIVKPIKASSQETNLNPRARSAILRVMEKLS